jgi:hypothetical protein
MKFIFIFSLVLFCFFKSVAQPLEEMEFILSFSFIEGGKVNVVARSEKLNRKEVIHYYVKGKTIGLINKLYEINDIYESWVDPQTNLPLKSVRNVREEKYKFYDEIVYDHDNDSIISLKSGHKKVPNNLNDLVSVFFYLRQNDYLDKVLKGIKFELPVINGNDLFMMHLDYLGTETIHTKFGRKLCYVLAPKIPDGKIVSGTEALRIYITTDENHLPIYAEFDLMVGHLKCELRKYKINGINILPE